MVWKLRFILPLLLVSMAIFHPCTGQEISDFIHLDQFGYHPSSEKVAVLTDPQIGYNASESYQAGATLEVRNAESDAVVFSNTSSTWNDNAVHDQSGDAGWWFDFSALDQLGSYYIYDPSTNHRSMIFEISENPYSEVIRAATKAFYYNRCNATKSMPFAEESWTDGDNFPQDATVRSAMEQDNPATARDLTGGWFDAGDYNKYVTFAHNPVHQLLTSYEDNPDLFTDDWNLPESGDGIPDIINEIIWELDWLYKMVNADGTVVLKMGSLDYDINDAAPPSNNFAPRYYTPTCSSASLAIASVSAHAANVLQQFTELEAYSQLLESDAILCWNRFLEFYRLDSLEVDCDDLTVKAGDADWDEQTQINNALVAASYLYEMTGNSSFAEFITDNITRTTPFDTEFWSPEHAVLLEALLNYTLLDGVDQPTIDAINNSVITAVNNNWSNYFGFSNDDLYRSYAPDWVYFWGSNMTMANIGNLCNTISKYNVLPSENETLQRKAAELLHYFHGVNPQGLVYLSNMYQYGAERSANEIFHSWFNEGTDWDNALSSRFGPAPGFLSGGPNQGYTGNLSPPANQPVQKSYLDYNDAFTDVAYEITEPAIYYQAAYIQLLSNYVSGELVSSNSEIGQSGSKFQVFPNPTEQHITAIGLKAGHRIHLLNTTGEMILESVIIHEMQKIAVGGLPNGLYLIRVFDSNQHFISSAKVVIAN